MYADRYGLELDDAGMQMLLRGALEYDHEIEFWWNKLGDDSRRWVALHALRSENSPARMRALHRLGTVADAEPPVIPLQVAQTLEAETNEQTLLAGIAALEARGSGASDWRDTAFTPEIDRVLSNMALTSPSPAVTERAARAVGRVRSIAALQVIADSQREGAPRALQALALIRDEAPSLPPLVSPQARLYAWLTNTWRRLSDRPMGLVWRTLSGGLGAFLAIGINTYFTFRSGDIFNSQRWKLTVSIGLLCAVVYGALVLTSDELPSRLRGFWPRWARILASALFGLAFGMALWSLWTYLYLEFPLDTNLALFAGAGAGLGYVASVALSLPAWLALIVTAIATYIPLYVSFQNYMPPVLYYDDPAQIFTLTIPLAIILALGGYAPRLLHNLRVLWSRRPRKPAPLPQPQRVSELGARAPLVLDPDATELSGGAEPAGVTPSRIAPRISQPGTSRPTLAPRPLRSTQVNEGGETQAAPETPTTAAPGDALKTITDAPRPLRPAPSRSSRLRKPGDTSDVPTTSETPTTAAPDDALKTITDAPRPLRPAPLRPSRLKKPSESPEKTETSTPLAPDDALKTITDAPRPLRPAPRPASKPKTEGADETPATTETPTTAAADDLMKTITEPPRPLRPAPLRPGSKPKTDDVEPKAPETPPSEDKPEE